MALYDMVCFRLTLQSTGCESAVSCLRKCHSSSNFILLKAEISIKLFTLSLNVVPIDIKGVE